MSLRTAVVAFATTGERTTRPETRIGGYLSYDGTQCVVGAASQPSISRRVVGPHVVQGEGSAPSPRR